MAAPQITQLTLTPVKKRRTRPSFSPVKNPKVIAPSKRRHSTDAGEITTLPSDPDIPTAALDFEEFSFIGADGDMRWKNVGDYKKIFLEYLAENFGCSAVDYSMPFIVLEFHGDPPPEDQRPFTIAGAIAVWRSINDPPFIPFLGEHGQAEEITLDDSICDMMQTRKMPPDEVILYLANHIFTDCEAISLLWNTLVIELPEMETKDYLARLETLPMDLIGSPHSLEYHNGPLPNTPRRSRAIKPKPAKLEGMVADETDYVHMDGKFYPGSMISSIDKNGHIHSSVSAGILIERNGERRLTCSWHNWEGLVDSEQVGQTDAKTKEILQVRQGVLNGLPGTKVGFVRERIKNTDIALAQLDDGIKFENSFLDMKSNVSPKVFVSSEDQENGDRYLAESFVTGQQILYGYGGRCELTKIRRKVAHPELAGHKGLPHDDVAYVKCRQGAFATDVPIMDRKPFIRDSICGSVLLRYRDSMKNSKNSKSSKKDTPAEVLKRGEACGMMHFADLYHKYHDKTTADYLIFADAFDPLIKEGWTIVQLEEAEVVMPEVPKEQGLEVGVGVEESPSKKTANFIDRIAQQFYA
ncbi:hypothetical protein UCRPA7_6215 [Phaeoacremonium minimum UCRPA7]|uniref:Uncharacterized protein n=1 Tax=Phaeoacremonium minimum (strain UCR-PA7) TaxID=1286976 RepID=R8BG17_PHAM7|nr:hypothetical protein UCRPA7_6215 [Phaeoacremonium minimum UCRPA7]EON98243.1 hypothetical protein UCRPA7_6215 [Phaeoacremonium minimum UCRPA7]